jgi:transcriptional regulator with XRE-family HTH domain
MDGYGIRFKIVRQNAGMNQLDFAESLGIKQGYVSQLETEKEKPSELLINAICSKFGIKKEWLVYGTEEMNEGLEARILWEIKLLGLDEVKKSFIDILKANDEIYMQPIIDTEFNNIMEWLFDFWMHSDNDMRSWIKVQLKRTFPEYDQQKKSCQDSSKDTTNNL